jgi:hypothetical protein
VIRAHAPTRHKWRADYPLRGTGPVNGAEEGIRVDQLAPYAVAKLAGIPISGTVRNIEAGRDDQLSNVQAVARVLGLRLELVEEQV